MLKTINDMKSEPKFKLSSYPLIGHVPQFLSDKLGFLTQCAASGEPVIKLQIGQPTYLLNDPEDIRHVLEVNSENYTKSLRMISKRGKRLSGEGLLTSYGPAHLQQRRLLKPVFMRKTIAIFADEIVRGSQEMLAHWTDGAELDIAEAMMRLVHRNIGRLLFSADFWHQDRSLGEAVLVRRRYIQYLFNALVPFSEYLPNSINREYRQAIRLIDEAIAEKIHARRQAPEQYQDLLSLLVQARYKDGTEMTDRQVRDEALTISVTGYETIGEALTWTWYLLAQHPEAAAKVWDELERVLEARSPTVEEIPQLCYTKMVLDESMRLYPPTWIYIRMARQPDILPSGVTVPAGTKLYLCPFVMHRNPHYFPNPTQFDPERFSEVAKQSRPKFAYFPFGGGPRICIGQALAEMEGLLTIATVAQQFRLSLMPNQTILPEPGITLRPKYGLWMKLHRC